MAGGITHVGIVDSVNDHEVVVRIVRTSACASCVAKGLCHSSESKEMLVNVKTTNASLYKIGDNVEISLDLKNGMKATFWAFVMPVVLFIALTSLLIHITHDEPRSVLISFGVLAVGAVVVYFINRNSDKSFEFTIKHLN